MGNVLTDGNGNVLISNNNALEVTSSIDSNIQAGNIKKDVTILGVTGTYEGSGGGGFRCTNKRLFSDDSSIFPEYNTSFTYTFNGTVSDCAIAIIYDGDADSVFCTNSRNWSGSTTVSNLTALKFQNDFSCAPHTGNSVLIASSLSLLVRGESIPTIISVEVNNNNTVTFTSNTTGFGYADPSGHVTAVIIFKGSDGSYDFDILKIEVYTDD